MTKKYNTALDVSFAVEHDCEDPADIPVEDILAALEMRLAHLRRNPQEAAEAFGTVDTYEIPEGRGMGTRFLPTDVLDMTCKADNWYDVAKITSKQAEPWEGNRFAAWDVYDLDKYGLCKPCSPFKDGFTCTEPFILVWPTSEYLIEPSGYDYARYIARIEGVKP